MKRFSFFIVLLFFLSCQTQQRNVQKSDDHHKIAIGLIRECDKPRALAHLLKAVKLNPEDFLIRHTLATVYYSMDRYDKALIEFKKILKKMPSFTEARVNLARVYIDLNRPDLALKEMKIAEEDMTYTDYLKIISQKALAYHKKGRHLDSKKWLEEALSLPKGKNCFTYVQLGKVELALGKLKRSEQLLKKALSVCKKEKFVCSEPAYEEHLALAQLYIKKGDKGRAKYHLKLFLQKVKKGPDIKKANQLLKKISKSPAREQVREGS